MKHARHAVPTSATDHPADATPRSPELTEVIRQLRGLQNVTSPSQPLDREGREYVSDQMGRLVEELERLLMGGLLGTGMIQCATMLTG